MSVLHNPDFLYIRKPILMKFDFILFLWKLRRSYPNTIIMMEIPTYPYSKEIHGMKRLTSLPIDVLCRPYLRNMLTYIVDLFGNKSVFGIPTIQIRNGVLVHDTDVRLPSGCNSEIRMIRAATFDRWHGIDRLISGMHKYYQNAGRRRLKLMLVGDGPEIPSLKQQVDDMNLQSSVSFLGRRSPEDVRKLYSYCNLGVESLARFRTSNVGTLNSSLKSREYLDVGISFFGEGSVDVLDDVNFKYYHQVESTNAPVDMGEIIQFFDGIYCNESEQDVINHIHSFPSQNVDLHKTFSNVVKMVKSANRLPF